MPIHLATIDHDRDWPAMSQLLVDSLENTYDSFHSVRKESGNDPACYMMKAVDSNTGDIVGASIWFIYTSTQKQRVSKAGPTTRPHVYLFDIATHPSHDAAGIAQYLMQWGLDRADSLGLEVWTYATSPETALYSSHGFESIEEMVTESNSIWSLRRLAVNNRSRYKAAYVDTQGFW